MPKCMIANEKRKSLTCKILIKFDRAYLSKFWKENISLWFGLNNYKIMWNNEFDIIIMSLFGHLSNQKEGKVGAVC